MLVNQSVKQGEISATVFRCQHNDICNADGRERPCRECKAVELGVVSYYNRNPFKRLEWQFKQLFQEIKNKWRPY